MVAIFRRWRTSLVHPAVMEEMDGTELALDFETRLVDFFRVNPGVLPEANSLLAAAQHWVEEGGDRVKFYSAAEEEALTVPQTPQTKQKKPKAPAAPKRVTTAALAEQLAAVPEALPNITGGGPRLPPHQQPCAPAAVKETSGVKLRSQIFLPSSL